MNETDKKISKRKNSLLACAMCRQEGLLNDKSLKGVVRIGGLYALVGKGHREGEKRFLWEEQTTSLEKRQMGS